MSSGKYMAVCLLYRGDVVCHLISFKLILANMQVVVFKTNFAWHVLQINISRTLTQGTQRCERRDHGDQNGAHCGFCQLVPNWLQGWIIGSLFKSFVLLIQLLHCAYDSLSFVA